MENGIPDQKSEKPESILRNLGVDAEHGLTEPEAATRIRNYGRNMLPESGDHGILRILFDQVKEPLILVLVIIGIVYFFIGTPLESFAVIAIVFTVIIIEVYNVRKARISIQALRNMISARSWVMRGGEVVEIPVTRIVPGDIVFLRTGDRVPADGIILSCFGLDIDESPMTGESFPVHKSSYLGKDNGESRSGSYMVMSGTLIVQGNGKFAVTATGLNTEMGRISESIRESEEPPTPLELSLNRTARLLIMIAVVFSVVIPLIGFVHGNPLDQMILTGMSMAFATVPEEVPILITITLAIGAYSLSKKRAIVKGLTAAQTLGSVTVIASDKTGTITENSMQISHVLFEKEFNSAEQKINRDFLEYSILATGNLEVEQGFSEVYKDPMEVSILKYSVESGIDIQELRKRYRPINQFAFDSENKRASYIYRTANSYVAYTSGAPEIVLSRCSHFISAENLNMPMSKEYQDFVRDKIDDIAGLGERAIAVAYREISDSLVDRTTADDGMTFVGLVSFNDPPRKGVKEAVKLCQDAGIRVIMLTGDHPITAATIGEMVGIKNGKWILTGSEISSMSDEDLAEAVKKTSIFARISHDEKLRIVKTLQKEGEIVAVTGDGVNDAPALRAAEIGVSMGKRGTEVAKEASDMVLQDDNFLTIAEAVFEGRKMQYTLKKGIRYYIAVKISLISILLIPVILLIPFPFMPIQIIIMELFIDVGAMWGFLYERDEVGILYAHPSGRNSNFMDRNMIRSILSGALGVFLAVTFVYLYIYYGEADVAQAQTAAFATWILSQVILAQNLRTEREPVSQKGFFSNPVILVWGLIIVSALIVITLYAPLHSIIDTSTLGYADWGLIVLASFLSSSWMEIKKLISRKVNKSKNSLTVTDG